MRRVCLLTGASGALGTAFIDRCGTQYQIVAVHHTNVPYCATQDQEFVDPLSPSRALAVNDGRVYSIRADLREPDEIARTVAHAIERFGPVDLLINGAAVRHFAELLDRGAADSVEDVLGVNVIAPLKLAVQLAHDCWSADPAANLRANRNVVNVSSTAGLFVYPDLGQSLYATSKAALNHLTYHLASELWDIGIRVNAVAPDTFPGRVATGDVIDAIVNLDRSTMTGQIIRFDSGRSVV